MTKQMTIVVIGSLRVNTLPYFYNSNNSILIPIHASKKLLDELANSVDNDQIPCSAVSGLVYNVPMHVCPNDFGKYGIQVILHTGEDNGENSAYYLWCVS